MKPTPQNLNIKTTKSEDNLLEKSKPSQKKISANDMSPTIVVAPFSNKSLINNINTDNSINEDFLFLKNEIHTPALRKETNLSITSCALKTAVSFNVSLGKIQDGMAVLLGDDLNLLELPLELLPSGTKKGNIFKVSIERNLAEEETRKDSILNVQKEVLENEKFFKVYD